MYDLKKIIITGTFDIEDEENLSVYIMKTNGLKIEKVTFITSRGFIGENKDDLINDIKSELYDDQYDDDIIIKIKEAADGHDAINKIVKFISKNWSNDTLIYYYLPDSDVFDKIKKECHKISCDIYIENFEDLIDTDEKDIYSIMKDQGLKMENLIKDSQISFIYYLSALVEKLMSR